MAFLVLLILIVTGAALFALGFFVGRRSRPAGEQRGFEVVSVHDEKQH